MFFLLKVVWFAAWLGVVLLGIDVGLGVGVIMALAVVLWKSSRLVFLISDSLFINSLSFELKCAITFIISGHQPHSLAKFPTQEFTEIFKGFLQLV